MNPFSKLAFWRKKPVENKRQFDAAQYSRLTSDWLVSNTNADSELRGNIKEMRNRCRDLERNNDYVRRYLRLIQNNVLGANGIGLQMKVRERVKTNEGFVERYDTIANNIIEDSFRLWTRKETCTVSQNQSWLDLQRVVLQSCARDGAILVRKHYPKDNPFFFCLEPIEIDQLDTDRNESSNGYVTTLGVRKSASGKVLGYWLLRNHPGEMYQPSANGKWAEFVEAKNIMHIYMPERVGQSTGYPWIASSLLRLRNLSQYESAELVASRIAAAKMGFLIPNATASGGYSGSVDERGNKYMEVEPGSIEQLPYGYDFKAFDPTHPSTAFKDFVSATLRGISAGLGVSYFSLANDLESVNYSTARVGLLEEREGYKTIQSWFIEWFVRPVFEEWLSMAAAAGMLKNSENGLVLPASKLAKWNQPEFKPRRWDWVDPLKDLQASVLAVEKGFKSRREIIGESGGDIEDTFNDIAADEDLAESQGLSFKEESGQQANVQQSTPDAPD